MSGIQKPIIQKPIIQDTKVNIDKPHKPWGQHVDAITPFDMRDGYKGAEKIRFDTTGNIMSHDINISIKDINK